MSVPPPPAGSHWDQLSAESPEELRADGSPYRYEYRTSSAGPFNLRNAAERPLVPSRPMGAGRAACPFRLSLVRAPLRFRGLSGSQHFVGLAGVAELVDALDLGSSIARCGGSSPFARTSSGAGTAEGLFGRLWNADRREDQRRAQARLHGEDTRRGDRGANRRRG